MGNPSLRLFEVLKDTMIPVEANVHLCYCTITIRNVYLIFFVGLTMLIFTDIAPRDQRDFVPCYSIR